MPKKIVVPGVAAVAAAALCGPVVASSWAEGLPPNTHAVYCYTRPAGEPNPVRVHLTDIATPSSDQMSVTQTSEEWDEGENRYIPQTSVPRQETMDPKWATEMTYICQLFLGRDYRYATGG